MARYIDANALSNDMAKVIKQLVDKGVPCTGLKLLKQIIDDEPTADVTPVRYGKWVEWDNYDGTYKCSVCGTDWDITEGTPQDNGMYYCPNCGAKMEEVDNET